MSKSAISSEAKSIASDLGWIINESIDLRVGGRVKMLFTLVSAQGILIAALGFLLAAFSSQLRETQSRLDATRAVQHKSIGVLEKLNEEHKQLIDRIEVLEKARERNDEPSGDVPAGVGHG